MVSARAALFRPAAAESPMGRLACRPARLWPAMALRNAASDATVTNDTEIVDLFRRRSRASLSTQNPLSLMCSHRQPARPPLASSGRLRPSSRPGSSPRPGATAGATINSKQPAGLQTTPPIPLRPSCLASTSRKTCRGGRLCQARENTAKVVSFERTFMKINDSTLSNSHYLILLHAQLNLPSNSQTKVCSSDALRPLAPAISPPTLT